MEKPYKGRATLHDNFPYLEIIIPTKKNWFVIIFIGGWLGGWVLGEVSAITLLSSNLTANTGEFFILFWLIAWTAIGFFTIKTFLWNLRGKEIITVGQGQLTIDKKAALFFKPKIYDLSEVKDIRYEDSNFSEFLGWNSNSLQSYSLNGSIKFDYGLRTVKFAADLDEIEAKFIIEMLKEKYIKK